MSNILPIRRTLSAGQTFCLVNCSWFIVKNLDTANDMYVRNCTDDPDSESNIIPAGTSYQDPGAPGQNKYAQVIFDGSNLAGDASFTVIAMGTINLTPYANAQQLQTAGLLNN